MLYVTFYVFKYHNLFITSHNSRHVETSYKLADIGLQRRYGSESLLVHPLNINCKHSKTLHIMVTLSRSITMITYSFSIRGCSVLAQ